MLQFSLTLSFCLLATFVDGAAIITAPQRCPLQNGNLLDVDLFVFDDAACKMKCEKHEKCFFYFFYTAPTKNRQPPQCFLYETCDRLVEPALEDCPIGKENTIGVMAFMEKEEDCIISCSKNDMCSFYKYHNSEDDKQPMMCYHLRSCVPKLVKRSECPLEKNNYIDHRLFVQSDRQCRSICEETPDCRFYYWYPIDYSPSPLYCYLFRSCINGGEEPLSALIAGGRHPGQYFLTGGESVDFLVNNDVCNTMVEPDDQQLGIARGGAVSDMVADMILLCGGRDTEGTIRDDCISYNYTTNAWSEHSTLLAPREEAACTVVAEKMYVLGGIIDGEQSNTVEIWDDDTQQWVAGPDMPEVRARFCAVPVDERFLAVIGGEMDGEILNSMKTLDLETDEWRMQAQTLKTPRKDHACVATRLDDEEGILVTGGVDADNRPLASVEFFSIPKQEWVDLADLTIARTEHGLAVINGIPTVVGGVATDEFLASVEQLDSSNKQDVLYQREWRLVAQALSTPRYDFSMAHLPTSKVDQEKVCKAP